MLWPKISFSTSTLPGVGPPRPTVQMALDHRVDDAAAAAGRLGRDVVRHVHLLLMLLGTGGRDAGGTLVRRLGTTQDNVRVLVSVGRDDGDLPVLDGDLGLRTEVCLR